MTTMQAGMHATSADHLNRSSARCPDQGVLIQTNLDLAPDVSSPVLYEQQPNLHPVGAPFQVPAAVVREAPTKSRLGVRRRRQRAAKVVKRISAREGSSEVLDARHATTSGRADSEAAQAQVVAQFLLEQLKADGDAKQLVVASFGGLAFSDKVSSRATQLVLSGASARDAALLAAGLRGRVREAMQSMYANYVLQKIVELLPTACTSFIVEELLGVGTQVARHPFGCRVLCRLLEFHSATGVAALLFEEVLQDADALVRHSFGNFVMGHVLEYGLPEHRQMVVTALRKDPFTHASDKFASHSVEAALQHSAPEERSALASDLLALGDGLVVLAHSQFGCHVVKALLRVPGHRQQVISLLCPVTQQLHTSKYGQGVLEAMDTMCR